MARLFINKTRSLNYKTEKYKYLLALILIVILGGAVIVFFGSLLVIMYFRKTWDWVQFIIPVVSSFVILRIGMYPFIMYLGSSLFDITLYKDRFEIKRIIKNITIVKSKTIYYKDILSLTDVSPIFGLYQDKEAEATVFEIKLNNKKTISIMLSAISKESKEEFMEYIAKYTNVDIGYVDRFIFKFK